MTYHFNVIGTDRKNLVKAISEHIGVEAKYLGAPSFAYQVGEFTVSKDGAVSCVGNAAELIIALAASGFCAEETEVNQAAGGVDEATGEDNNATGEDNATSVDEAGGEDKPTGVDDSIGENDAKTSEEPTTLSISLPRHMFNDVALENLKALIQAKGVLMKRAFRTDSLDIEIEEEKV